MTPAVCNLCTPDWWLVVIGAVLGLVAGVGFALLGRRALDQDDYPDDAPPARPFADEGGPR
ncbi:hypothetical protein [Ancylobacter sp.]|uniref:hypothetical protein n=1 Tax=Ancylobacter sp. TaxID=1872567 RepID=UPI003D152517